MEEEFKCPSCGACLDVNERYCSYCGSRNEYYKKFTLDEPKHDTEDDEEDEKDIEDDEDEKESDEDFDLGDMFGGLFGGMMIGSTIKRIKKSIMKPFANGRPFIDVGLGRHKKR